MTLRISRVEFRRECLGGLTEFRTGTVGRIERTLSEHIASIRVAERHLRVGSECPKVAGLRHLSPIGGWPPRVQSALSCCGATHGQQQAAYMGRKPPWGRQFSPRKFPRLFPPACSMIPVPQRQDHRSRVCRIWGLAAAWRCSRDGGWNPIAMFLSNRGFDLKLVYYRQSQLLDLIRNF